MSKEKILVVGANGTTGKLLTEMLGESEKYVPVAMIRKEEQKAFFENRGIEVCLADLSDEDLNHTTVGIDKVVFAAGSKGKALEEVDKKGAMKMVDAAKKNKAKKFVMLSSIGASDPDKDNPIYDYLVAKKKADDYLKASGLNYTINCPGALKDREASGQIMIKDKLISGEGAISRADVAKTLMLSLGDDTAKNKAFEYVNGEVDIAEASKTYLID